MASSWPKNRVLAAVVVAVVSGWVFVAVAVENGISDWKGAALFGVLFGTIFGQVALAGAWCALGPFSLATRLPFSAGWMAALILALGCLISRDGPSDGAFLATLLFGAAFVGQWMLVQIPIWLVVVVFGLSVRHGSELEGESGLKDRQFGTRQLMVLTVIVAVVLGVGRLLFGAASQQTVASDWSGMIAVFVVAFCHALMALPLVVAALLRNNVVLGVCAALLLVALATLLEVPLLRFVEGPSNSPPYESLMVGLMSGIQASWIMGVVILLRMAGYELVSRSKSMGTASGML